MSDHIISISMQACKVVKNGRFRNFKRVEDVVVLDNLKRKWTEVETKKAQYNLKVCNILIY